MKSYLRYEIDTSAAITNKTLRLDAGVKKIYGIFLLWDKDMDYRPVRIGIKYNDQQQVPNDFDGSLILHTGALSIEDTILPTYYEPSGVVTVEVLINRGNAGSNGGSAPYLSLLGNNIALYFQVEM